MAAAISGITALNSRQHFRCVFERLNPSSLAECLYEWLGLHRLEGSVIAIDGKMICGSKSENHKASHVVSAFVAENQLYWCLDVIFREDDVRARKDLFPLNLDVLRKAALMLCRNAEFGKRVSL